MHRVTYPKQGTPEELKEARRQSHTWGRMPSSRAGGWPIRKGAKAGHGCMLAPGACGLCRHRGSHTPKGSMLGLMLCFSIMKFVNTFWARDPAFPSCTGSHKLHSQFCSSEIQLCHLREEQSQGNPLAFPRLTFCFCETQGMIPTSNTLLWERIKIVNYSCIVW